MLCVFSGVDCIVQNCSKKTAKIECASDRMQCCAQVQDCNNKDDHAN